MFLENSIFSMLGGGTIIKIYMYEFGKTYELHLETLLQEKQLLKFESKHNALDQCYLFNQYEVFLKNFQFSMLHFGTVVKFDTFYSGINATNAATFSRKISRGGFSKYFTET